MALSADNEDPYAKIIDENVFLRAKSGGLVPAPEQLTFDYDSRTIRRTAEADGDFATTLASSRATDGNVNTTQFSEEQWNLLRNLAQAISKSKVQFTEEDWMSAMQIINNASTAESGVADAGNGTSLSQPQLDVLHQTLRQTKAY
jgi:hypothetical protein